jgi:putative drug exporter of the RND superfamily
VLMVTIFAAFLTVPLVTVQQMGFAAAIAIAIDATLIRLVMVPAAMRLMGRWNWWLPRGISGHRGALSRRDQLRTRSEIKQKGAQWVP